MTNFAFFPEKLLQLSQEIADTAVADDWFVIDDPADRPTRLVEHKLNLAFAMAVRKLAMGEPSALTVGFDSARFDTGFVTPEGRHIVALFALNDEISTERHQRYVFTGIELR